MKVLILTSVWNEEVTNILRVYLEKDRAQAMEDFEMVKLVSENSETYLTEFKIFGYKENKNPVK